MVDVMAAQSRNQRCHGRHLTDAVLSTQAASTLAALAVAEPSFAAGVLSDLMGMLGNSCQRLATMRPTTAGDGSSVAAGPGPARGVVPENMKRAINSVNGYALGVASLLGASTRCATEAPPCHLPLGIRIGISYARNFSWHMIRHPDPTPTPSSTPNLTLTPHDLACLQPPPSSCLGRCAPPIGAYT